MKTKLIYFILLIFCTVIYSQRQAYNEEFQVNTYTTQCQLLPGIAVLNNEGFVVCWRSDGQDSSYSSIYAQLYDKDFERIGEEFKVNTYKERFQTNPRACGLSNGGFIICWNSSIQDGDDSGVYAQLFYENGTKNGDEFRVNTYLPGNQYLQSISRLNNGSSFIICWMSSWQDSSGKGIYAQIFNEDGTKIGNEFRVNTYTEDDQSNPAVSGLNNGGFVICWDSKNQDKSGTSVYAKLFDSSGSPIGDEFLVNTYSAGWQYNPSVSKLTNGGFVISWESAYQDGSYEGIYAQVFDENAAKVRNEFHVNTYTNNRQINPVVRYLNNGEFVIAWNSLRQDGSDWGVFAQMYFENGEKQGNEFRVNSTTANTQEEPRIALLPSGELLFCWQSSGQDGSYSGVFGKYFLSDALIHELYDFDLLTPEIGDTLRKSNPIFKWQSANKIHINYPWELTYDLYIYPEVSSADTIIITGIQDTIFNNKYLSPFNSYYWFVMCKNLAGDSLRSLSNFNFTIDPNAVVEVNTFENELPEKFELSQNYPNPFNPTTKIKFTIPVSDAFNASAANVKLTVYDLLGNEVTTLVDEQKSPGNYEVEFDASVSRRISSGIYFYKIKAGNFTETNKMILLK